MFFAKASEVKGRQKLLDRIAPVAPGVWHPGMSVHHVVLACSPSDNEWPHKPLLSQDSLVWGAPSPLRKACCILTLSNTEADHQEHPQAPYEDCMKTIQDI